MALQCDSEIAAESLPLLPLFPGRRQRWMLVVRAAPDVDVEPLVRGIFRRWTALIPGPVGEPEILSPEESPASSLIQPPKLGFREPTQLVGVTFDYTGQDTAMRWPTYVQRRRDRIDPLCPTSPTDAMPIAVEAPDESEELEGGTPLPPPTSILDDPWDAGLPPIDPGQVKSALKWAAGGTALAAGLGLGLVLLYGLRRR